MYLRWRNPSTTFNASSLRILSHFDYTLPLASPILQLPTNRQQISLFNLPTRPLSFFRVTRLLNMRDGLLGEAQTGEENEGPEWLGSVIGSKRRRRNRI